MIENKDEYKDNQEVYKMLSGLEKAIADNDELKMAILITQLREHKLSLQPSELK